MANINVTKTPFIQSSPNALEQIFANQVPSNPMALGLTVLEGANRRIQDSADNAALGQYYQDAQEQAAAAATQKSKFDILQALASQQGTAPAVAGAVGLDPTLSEQLLQSLIGKNVGDTTQSLGASAKSISDIGGTPAPSILDQLTAGGSLGERPDVKIANIGAAARLKAAGIRAAAGGGSHGPTTSTAEQYFDPVTNHMITRTVKQPGIVAGDGVQAPAGNTPDLLDNMANNVADWAKAKLADAGQHPLPGTPVPTIVQGKKALLIKTREHPGGYAVQIP